MTTLCDPAHRVKYHLHPQSHHHHHPQAHHGVTRSTVRKANHLQSLKRHVATWLRNLLSHNKRIFSDRNHNSQSSSSAADQYPLINTTQYIEAQPSTAAAAAAVVWPQH